MHFFRLSGRFLNFIPDFFQILESVCNTLLHVYLFNSDKKFDEEIVGLVAFVNSWLRFGEQKRWSHYGEQQKTINFLPKNAIKKLINKFKY